jgi:folate-binding protein YgfZ
MGVIAIEGEDAAPFIHGQLTQDFALLDRDSARLAAFCNAKGRMLASFVGVKRSGGQILLVCSRDLLAPTLKRLTMYVMRAKARLHDASEQFDLYGVAGTAIDNVAFQPMPVWGKSDIEGATVVQLYPAAGVERQLWIVAKGAAAPPGNRMPPGAWSWGEVRSGIATVSESVVEAFLPQMLNYESVGGVNFKKGCYPGQEVVARSQFRGTLKRRAFLVHSEAPLNAGQELFSPSDATQPAGVVVQSAAAPPGGWDAIVSVAVRAVTDGSLHLGTADGPILQVLPLPYPILDDI